MERVTKSAEESKKFAANFAKKLKGGDVLCLYGELGSGKTTFVQGLAEGLGIKKRILSPTFILMRSYEISGLANWRISELEKTKTFYHIDLYRIDKPQETEMLGLQEILDNPQNIIAIEWAEKIKEILPPRRIDIHFKHIDYKDSRLIKIINFL
ncbi:MAG: tRNA (adenosine(37)-N6)-threonylcarbamoyltransferase complex ATPase subunit type 1 TsaE [Candidatus Cloacimonetes bacterium]|nr:tRNA (adenosine(37)-N6)-threonylcarbamoyltransferase complex ATPase subunit type 1 TsaE [Candidatus Cloacimonadota bacterium]